ncbi:MAG: 50S ribosomal protein L18 [SAR202 cluster bacterium]|nr:50S ribosomal protein L18 [Chloroflexota bacterium]MDP6420707.1 50S ribosomal protein L18 [SAR202 cluster bacterium]HAL48625.1 50S ribosomal protein L18 [Dehalococcoidia bacterium]MDP6663776.1 50S ribosomal protein L18 [SAR202 cluster bacterium]MDP6798587.1 50S ribosomal protein L18 [SAR202 cluster bacterium]
MAKPKTGKSRRTIRHKRVRRKISGSSERPRLAIFRSLNHVYAQVIDDSKGVTLVAASSLDTEVKQDHDGKAKTEVSALVGKLVAERAKEKGVTSVVFDRGGFKFHGRAKALAEAARKEGLVF